MIMNQSKPRSLLIYVCGGFILAVLIMYFAYNHQYTPTIKYKLLPIETDNNDELKRLGLTPKKYVNMITENGELVIKGRFLHLTDMHPDDQYKEGSSIDEACHGGKGQASKYGDAILGCDSPLELMYETIDWIDKNLKDKIDFIIWTGDNMRHDNDRNFPRSEMQIFEMNDNVSKLLYETFKSTNSSNPRLMDVELIPSLGNNDVYPHNLFAPGPTLQTREMYQIWKNFIPQSQLHVFNRGAYYFQEVIPNQLAVLSINTLYLFQSNPLVDNCDKRKEPGYKLFEWLGNVLKEIRARNMKVWLSGHVPPNEKNYDISCLRKYIVWVHEYRDVIIGGIFGHMNIDHFIPLDSVAAYKSINQDLGTNFGIDSFEIDNLSVENQNEEEEEDEDEDDETLPLGASNYWNVFNENFDKDFMRIQGGVPKNKVQYMESLREEIYAGLKGKKKSGKSAERYSIANVGASVIPTFNPGLRVYEYNISGMENSQSIKFASWDTFFEGLNKLYDEDFEPKSKKETNIRKKKGFPPKMPENAKLGPGYTRQTFTPERYVQYYLDLAKVNSGEKKFEYEIEYRSDDKIYGMSQLTVDEYLKLGRQLGAPVKSMKSKGKKHKNKPPSEEQKLKWKAFLKYSFINSGYEDMGYG